MFITDIKNTGKINGCAPFFIHKKRNYRFYMNYKAGKKKRNKKDSLFFCLLACLLAGRAAGNQLKHCDQLQ